MSDPDLTIKPPTTVAVVQESVGADPRVRPIVGAQLVAPTPADLAVGGVVDPGQAKDIFVATGELAAAAKSWLVTDIAGLTTPRLIHSLPAEQYPLNPADIVKFLASMDRDDESRALAKKIVAALSVIDRQLFLQGLVHMAHAIENFVGDEPYTIIVNGRGGSGAFVVKELWLYLKRKPANTITHEYLMNHFPVESLEHFNPSHKIIILDDAAYSGSDVMQVRAPLAARGISGGQILVAMVGLTKTAFVRLGEKMPNIAAWVRIPQLQEILTMDEIKKLEGLFYSVPWTSNLSTKDIFSFFYYRIPDNFYLPLIRSFNEVLRHGGAKNIPHYLADNTPSGITRPYARLEGKVHVLDTSTFGQNYDPNTVPTALKTNLQWPTLMDIVTAETSTADSGYPIISRSGFRLFEDQVSHLFHEGQVVLDWLAQLEKNLSNHPLPRGEGAGGGWPPQDSILRAIKVLRTVILTASITAPTDLWLTRQILATHQRLGILEYLKNGATLVVANVAEEKNLLATQLDHDLQFLHARGYLDRTGDGYVLAKGEAGAVVTGAAKLTQFAADWHIDWAAEMIEYFRQGLDAARLARLEAWLAQRIQEPSPTPGWIANLKEIEIGYKLVPLVIALKASGLIENVKSSPNPDYVIPAKAGIQFLQSLLDPRFRGDDVVAGMQRVLEDAGLIRGGQVTEFGEKVFADGSGPFGIIYAYNTYLNQHEALLNNSGERPWVQRGPNIVASRDANKATFQKAIQALGRFMRDESWSPEVMVEHALGLGVAIQTFVEKFGVAGYHFVGADYEEAALAGARREQAEGRLPQDMKFLQADIGDPDKLVIFLKARWLPTTSTVMVVGAGFHEVRNKTDEQMIEVFRKYCEAGIILIFAETSDLTDEQLRDTGWQTYHAGFRWAHLTSGQNLRIPWPMEGTSGRKSWLEIAGAAGYAILDDYSPKKRPIYPRSLVPENNPPLEVTFFAVPDNHPTLGSRLEPARIQKATATPASGGLVSQQPVVTEGLTLDFLPHKNTTHTPKLLHLEDAQENPHVVVFERRSVTDAKQILRTQNYPDLAKFNTYPPLFKGFVDPGHTVFLARNLQGEVLGYALVTFGTDENPGSVKAHRLHKKDQNFKSELKGLGLALMAYVMDGWWPSWTQLQPRQGVAHALLPEILQNFRSRTYGGWSSPIPLALHDEWDPGRKYPNNWIPKEEAEFVLSLFHFTPVTPIATPKSKQRIHPLPRSEGVGGGCHLATSGAVFSGEAIVMGAGPVVEKEQALAESVAAGSTENTTQPAGGDDAIVDQTIGTDNVSGPGFLGWRAASRAVRGFARAFR